MFIKGLYREKLHLGPDAVLQFQKLFRSRGRFSTGGQAVLGRVTPVLPNYYVTLPPKLTLAAFAFLLRQNEELYSPERLVT